MNSSLLPNVSPNVSTFAIYSLSISESRSFLSFPLLSVLFTLLVNVWTSALVSRFISVSANVLVSAFGNFKWHAQVTSPGPDIIAQFVGKCLGLWYLQVVR